MPRAASGSAATSPPKPFKPGRVGRGIAHGVLYVPVAEVVLNQARVRALVGQGEAASVAQHVGMGGDLKPCRLASAAKGKPYRFAGEWAAPFADKKRLGVRPHPCPLDEPSANGAALVGA